MIPALDSKRFREMGLSPYQAKLITDVLDAPVPTRRLLVAKPGSGKTTVAMALAKEIARSKAGYRILVVGPRALASMYEHYLTQALPSATIVSISRRTLRELEEVADEGSAIWPMPFVAVIGMDTARQDDVRLALCSVHWDLVILEEVHLFARSRWTLLKTILTQDVFERVLLISATPDMDGVKPLLKTVARTEWLAPDLRDWDDKPLFGASSSAFSIVTYQRSADEIDLLRQVLLLAAELSNTSSAQVVRKSLLRQAASSPVALERTVRTLRNSLAHGLSDGISLDDVEGSISLSSVEFESDADVNVSSTVRRSPWQSEGRALAALGVVLDQLESVHQDTKRESLEALLTQLETNQRPGLAHVCVFCSSKATAHYLRTAIADRGRKAWLVTSDTSPDQFGEELNGFESAGGVLICTVAMMKGWEFSYVQTFIHYDAPVSAAEMGVRTSRSPGAVNLILSDQSGVLPGEWSGVNQNTVGQGAAL